MKHFFPSVLLMLGLICLSSCGRSGMEKDMERIEILETRLRMSDLGTPVAEDPELFQAARELGERYTAFADQYPAATQTPEYLYRAGELYYHDLKDLPTAIQLLERNYQSYPSHETAPHSIFLIAYLYHNVQKNLIKAQTMYDLFLAQYPEHQLAAAVQFEVEQLGVSGPEIVDQINTFKDRKRPKSLESESSNIVNN